MALQVGAMKGNLKSIPVKYVLYNRDSIFIYDYYHHHCGNLDDLSLWVNSEIKNIANLFIHSFIYLFIYSKIIFIE